MTEQISQNKVERILKVIDKEVKNVVITDAHKIMAEFAKDRKIRAGIVTQLLEPAEGKFHQEIVEIDLGGQLPNIFTDHNKLTEIIHSSGKAQPRYYLYLGIPVEKDDVFCLFPYNSDSVWVGKTDSLNEKDFSYTGWKATALTIPDIEPGLFNVIAKKFGDKKDNPLDQIRDQLADTLISYLPKLPEEETKS